MVQRGQRIVWCPFPIGLPGEVFHRVMSASYSAWLRPTAGGHDQHHPYGTSHTEGESKVHALYFASGGKASLSAQKGKSLLTVAESG